MSLYHHIAILIKTEVAHWNRNDVTKEIYKIIGKLKTDSNIRKELEIAKNFISANNLSAANERFVYLRKMEEKKELEAIVKNEEKHFNFKKTFATVATLLTLGLYSGNAKADNPYHGSHNSGDIKVFFTDGKKNIDAFIRGDQVLSYDGKYLGYVNGNQIVVSNPAYKLISNNPLIHRKGDLDSGNANLSNNNSTTQIIPSKNYNFKTAKQYIDAANKAYQVNNYLEMGSITSDSLIKIKKKSIKFNEKEFKDLSLLNKVANELYNKNK